jgi:hypothetical protein
VEAAKSRIVSLRGDIRNFFLKNKIMWYSPEIDLAWCSRSREPTHDRQIQQTVDALSRVMGAARREAPPPSTANPRRRDRIAALGKPRLKFAVSQTFENS